MTAFHEILFPLDITMKSAGGPERRTEIVSFGSGREQRNARWIHSRRRYDAGYGVIRNIQDAEYGGRHHYSNILVPDFGGIAASLSLRHEKVSDLADFAAALARARAMPGAAIVEVDMVAIGHYPQRFAGPPRLTK